MARVRDVIEDEEWRLRPLSALLGAAAGILGCMIVYNAVFHQPVRAHLAQILPANTATRIDMPKASASGASTTTVVLKYDPLIEDVQRELVAVGLFKGMVDGVNGLRTKQAILQYQQLNGLPASGEPSEDLVNHMRFTRKVQAAAQFTGSVTPTPAVATAKAPSGVITSGDAQRVKQVQVTLAGLGYDINTVNGQVTEETRAAILKYEMDNGLDMAGSVDAGLLKALKITAN